MVAAARFDIVLVQLDPTRGSEIQKTRPCVVISPDELNRALRTRIVAPMTSAGGSYPWRVPVRHADRDGRIALDQLRTVDQERIIRRVGALDRATALSTLGVLAELFAP